MRRARLIADSVKGERVMTRTSAAVHVSDHSFGIFDHYEIPIETGDWSNGLIVTMASGAMIYTGIDRGYVNVTVELRTAAPEDVDPGSWDDIVEASINSPHGHLCVELLEYAADDVGPELPLLSPQGPGSYRMRAHVRGRDRFYDQVQNEPAEDYLLIVWPADPAPPLIIRATDTCGYGLRLGSTQQAQVPPPPESPERIAEQQVRAQLRQYLLDHMEETQRTAPIPGDTMDSLPAHTRGLLVLGGLGALAACGSGPADDLSAAPAPETTVYATAKAEPLKLDPKSTDSTPPPERLAVVTATEFATAWARPDLTQEQWWAGVSPWCARQLAPILRTTDHARIPARKVTGAPQLLGQRETGQLRYTVPTDAGPLKLTIIAEDGSWKVWTKKLIGSDQDAYAPHPAPRQQR